MTFLALHTEEKRYGQMGSTPCYLQSQVVSAFQSFMSVAPLFFLVPFLAFFLIQKRDVAYQYAHDDPLMTQIGPTPVIHRIKLCLHAKVLGL